MTTPDADGLSLVELLDERADLLALAFDRLRSGTDAESAVQAAYRWWFRLPRNERTTLPFPRHRLTRAVERSCAEMAASSANGAGSDDAPARRIHPPPVVTAATVVGEASLTLPQHTAYPRHDAARVPLEETVEVFALACRADDRPVLQTLLAADATAIADTGGRLRIDPAPVFGVDAISRFLGALFGLQPEIEMAVRPVNAAPGVLIRRGRQVVGVLSLGLAAGRVHQVWIVLNPEKLRRWNRS